MDFPNRGITLKKIGIFALRTCATLVFAMEMEIKQELADALYKAYKEGLQQGRFTSLRDASRIICKQPAPRYFITPDWARIRLCLLRGGWSMINLSPSVRRMMLQLSKEYDKFVAEHPGQQYSVSRIAEIIVMQPAPEYYITPEAVRRILRKVIRNVRREKGWGD